MRASSSSWIARLRHFFEPIDDRELPRLGAHMLRGVRTLAVVAMIAILLASLVNAITGVAGWPRALLVGAVNAAAAGLIQWLADPRAPRVRPSVAVLAIMTLITVGTTHSSLMSGGDMHGLASYSVVIPLIASTVFAWRPRWSLLLGVIATGLPLLGAREDIAISLPTYLLLGATYTAGAAVLTQMQRHRWLELERTRSQLASFDRLSTLGRMIAGIAHELKTPNATAANSLARVKALSSELRESIAHPDVTDADLVEIADELAAASELAARATERMGRFLQTIRTKTLGMHQTDVVELSIGDHVASAVSLIEHRARHAGVRIEAASETAVTVRGDPSKLEQVITNLVANAIEAIEEARQGTFVRISFERATGGARIVVEDDGPGIPEALRDRIFEPLVTTRAAHGGTGLGLSICRDVIEGAFGGGIELADGARGARFELWLPDDGAVAARGAGYAPGAS